MNILDLAFAERPHLQESRIKNGGGGVLTWSSNHVHLWMITRFYCLPDRVDISRCPELKIDVPKVLQHNPCEHRYVGQWWSQTGRHSEINFFRYFFPLPSASQTIPGSGWKIEEIYVHIVCGQRTFISNSPCTHVIILWLIEDHEKKIFWIDCAESSTFQNM